ncbi:molybdopterin molybdotransferase MoeA [Geomonas azotofigens]|uniref:molybdopterin molybdotransferase MoeA n=1 Tax=Geomonas azotofigens TaxID=2843196 RepID=UPI001C103A5D|nr:gephyrin-like molybdotransferase Glp [Geomonas azotofigens]MBU5613860.1 molybdopterin molybdotransferase MoeA [Geomonas azotofigens]
MISIYEAQQVILQHVAPLPREEIDLLQGLGRIIAEDVAAPWDVPTADNSAMDGYAFSHESLQSNRLKVTGFLPAGMKRSTPVLAGEAIKIMTGAPIPSGCDTVVPIEEVVDLGDEIRLQGDVKPGAHVRRRGDTIREGEVVIAAGTTLHASQSGLLASLGRTRVATYGRPRVAVIATGDELVEAGSVPEGAAVVNSNSHSIAMQILEAGAEPVVLGIARDTREATREMLLRGLEADVVITSGGVSVGDCDYVKEVVEELSGELLFWKVNIKPGKPTAFGMLRGKPFFGLPGNPVATMIAFEQFVRPALLKMMGHVSLFRPVVRATVTEGFRNDGERPHLVLCRLAAQEGRHVASISRAQGSSNLLTMARANGVIEVAPGGCLVPETEIEVTLLTGRV